MNKIFFMFTRNTRERNAKMETKTPVSIQIKFNMHLTLTQLDGPLVWHLGLDFQDIWMLFSWMLCKGGKEEDFKALIMSMIFMLNEFT